MRQGFASFLLATLVNTAAAAPNIVLIVSDNQSQSLLGTYGNSTIRTPNIDRLAAEGVQFNHAFAVNGVCSPTRATLMTGLLPSQTGVHVALPTDVDVADWSAIEEFRNLPQTLSNAGYRTALVGKYHLGAYEKPQLRFDFWVTFPGGHTTTFYDEVVIDNGKTYRSPEHLTDFWTRRAVDFIEQQSKERPFFLLLTYNGPYMLPPTVTMQPKNRHADYYLRHTPAFPQEPVHPYLQNWAMGRDPSGLMLREGTTAWTAISAYNINMQVPLIFRHPGRIPGGIENDRIINQVDILPTLLDYIGLGDLPIANSPGRSFAAMLAGEEIDWDDTVFFEFVTVRVIETPEWKYLRRFPPSDPRELYDLQADAGETRNLIDSPEHADIVAALDARLAAYFEQYADPQYDLWNGGTAKGRLLEDHYGRDDIFSERFADWRPPFVEKAKPFDH